VLPAERHCPWAVCWGEDIFRPRRSTGNIHSGIGAYVKKPLILVLSDCIECHGRWNGVGLPRIMLVTSPEPVSCCNYCLCPSHFILVAFPLLGLTSSSAIADRPRSMVGQFWPMKDGILQTL